MAEEETVDGPFGSITMRWEAGVADGCRLVLKWFYGLLLVDWRLYLIAGLSKGTPTALYVLLRLLDMGWSRCSFLGERRFKLFELGLLVISIVGKQARALFWPLDPPIPPPTPSGLVFLEGAPMEKISGGRFGGDSMSGILKYRSGLLFRKRRLGPWMSRPGGRGS